MRRSNLAQISIPNLDRLKQGRFLFSTFPGRYHGLLMKKREVTLIFAVIMVATLLYYFLPRLPIHFIGANYNQPTVEPRRNRTIVPAPTPKLSHEPPTKLSLEFPTKLSCRNRTWCEAQSVCLNHNTIFFVHGDDHPATAIEGRNGFLVLDIQFTPNRRQHFFGPLGRANFSQIYAAHNVSWEKDLSFIICTTTHIAHFMEDALQLFNYLTDQGTLFAASSCL